jgi:hypothetical protein
MMRLIVSAASMVCRVERPGGRSRRRSGRFRSSRVAHLADQDDVGVLAQGAFQGDRKALGVEADLALVDDALLVAVQVFDRVFDGDDVRRCGWLM